MKCRDCTNLHLIRECKNLLWCDDLLDAPNPDIERDCKYFKHATNGDRIRTMTDNELAHFMARVCPPGGNCNEGGNCFTCRIN